MNICKHAQTYIYTHKLTHKNDNEGRSFSERTTRIHVWACVYVTHRDWRFCIVLFLCSCPWICSWNHTHILTHKDVSFLCFVLRHHTTFASIYRARELTATRRQTENGTIEINRNVLFMFKTNKNTVLKVSSITGSSAVLEWTTKWLSLHFDLIL